MGCKSGKALIAYEPVVNGNKPAQVNQMVGVKAYDIHGSAVHPITAGFKAPEESKVLQAGKSNDIVQSEPILREESETNQKKHEE